MKLADARVLVTGGAGFIGSHVTIDLLEAGADVLVVDNLSSGKWDLVPKGASFREIDIRCDDIASVVTEYDPDCVAHLAAIHYIPYCNEHPEETFNVNVMGTRNVVDAARRVDLERFVFASSAAVYPPAEGSNAEDSELGPTDVYGRTKLVGEDMTELYHRQTGRDAAVARIFNTYGPNETNDHVVPAILTQVANGVREIKLGNLSPKRDYIHVTDVSCGIVKLLGGFDGGFRSYNLGTGTQYSVRELVETIERVLGEEIDIVQDGRRVRDSDRPHLLADPSRMRNEYGWSANIDLVDGLEELIKERGAITA